MTRICIAGVPGSGASTVARLLNLCGLDLPDEKAPPTSPVQDSNGLPEEPELVHINNRLLALFGGAWDLPPMFPSDWLSAKGLRELRQAATQRISAYDQHADWGWVDEASSLTQPFWRQLLPDLKVVVVVRSPLDLARWHAQGSHSSVPFANHLTGQYYRSLSLDAASDSRIVTHYDAFLGRTAEEIARLVEFLGLRVASRSIEQAAASLGSASHDAQATLRDLVHSATPWELMQDYIALCKQAGPYGRALFIRALQDQLHAGDAAADPDSWVSLVKTARFQFERDNLASSLDSEVLHLRELIAEREQRIYQLAGTLSALDRSNDRLQTALDRKERHVAALFRQLRELEEEKAHPPVWSRAYWRHPIRTTLRSPLGPVARGLAGPPESFRGRVVRRLIAWLRDRI